MGTNQNVRCYGCGREYDAVNAEASHRHTHHLGLVPDKVATRETVAAWLDMCQRERDDALQCLARRPSPGTLPEPSETAASARQTPANVEMWGQERNANLELRRQAALTELAAIHAERVETVRALRATMGPGRIADLLGVSRQQVHKLLRGE